MADLEITNVLVGKLRLREGDAFRCTHCPKTIGSHASVYLFRSRRHNGLAVRGECEECYRARAPGSYHKIKVWKHYDADGNVSAGDPE